MSAVQASETAGNKPFTQGEHDFSLFNTKIVVGIGDARIGIIDFVVGMRAERKCIRGYVMGIPVSERDADTAADLSV